ncbi:hypothetical protein ARALYDRAFT_337814 [Arabidopsis lyrata subsp. lyrata]|uniref:Uncharacterized protein n=1 Tax=Arabidopsis lyrata subsp. lyrata TaxID=81972 RepID=D7KAZ7_ARALL|nr:hypothetical protein ARALYDRAFT_337814 [Arabidopsis lyrata subsp. lyrata]
MANRQNLQEIIVPDAFDLHCIWISFSMEEKPGSTDINTYIEKEYPKRLLRGANEYQVRQINNTCRMSILRNIKDALPIEYEIIKRDPLFAHVFAIHENELGYSGRIIHNIICG